MNSLYAMTLITFVGLGPTVAILWWVKTLYPFEVQWRFIGLALVVGMVSAIPVALSVLPIKSVIYGLDHLGLATLYRAFVSASLLEETVKLLSLLFLMWSARLKRQPALLIIAGTATSLGFASFENMLYVADEGLSTAFIRAVTAIPCHAGLGTIMGYYLARAALGAGKLAYFKAWMVPVVLHGMYDFPLMAGFSGAFPTAHGMTLLLAFFALALLVLWSRYILFYLRAAGSAHLRKAS